MNTAALTMNGLVVNEVSERELLLLCESFDHKGKAVSRFFKLTGDGLTEETVPDTDYSCCTFSGEMLHHLAVITTAYQAGHKAGWKKCSEQYRQLWRLEPTPNCQKNQATSNPKKIDQ